MPCFRPVAAYQSVQTGLVQFHEGPDCRGLILPCGKCIGCRLQSAAHWSIRMTHEAQMHQLNCFVTLTYDAAHLPLNESLDHSHVQLFLKRLRRKFTRENPGHKFSFFVCGEYGDDFGRPHYHACLFGIDFTDRKVARNSHSDTPMYTSAALSAAWGMGLCTVQDFNTAAAEYCGRYVLKKITGPKADDHYRWITRYGEVVQRKPEYCRMSTRPAIGKRFFLKFKSDIYPHDRIVHNGIETKPSRYYDKLLKRGEGFIGPLLPNQPSQAFEDLKLKRYNRPPNFQDQTPERLAVRETCTRARLARKKRALEI